MPTPIREQLLSAITTAVGGKYNAPAPTVEEDAPVIGVTDEPDEAVEGSYGEQALAMPLRVGKAEIAEGSSEDEFRAQGHTMLAELIEKMFVDETFGGLADGIDYTGGGILTEVGKFIFAEAQFSVRYHTVRGNPYLIDEE